MRLVFYLFFSIILTYSCSGNRNKENQRDVRMNPTVQKWMDTDQKSAEELLPVLVVTSEPVKDYEFLRNVTGNSYTGMVTKEQLNKLLNDPRIKSISSDKKKLH